MVATCITPSECSNRRDMPLVDHFGQGELPDAPQALEHRMIDYVLLQGDSFTKP